MVRKDCHADARRDAYFFLTDGERGVQGVEDALGRSLRGRRIVKRLDQDGEFIPAQARDRFALANSGPEPLGGEAQDLVAGRMAELVVDRLESVQVDI